MSEKSNNLEQICSMEIVGFEGLYLVTSDGRIISKNYLNHGQTKELKQQDNGTGYLYVVLQKNKNLSKNYVHRIVTRAFLGECPPDKEVNHKDLNRKNNNIKNLEYVTRSENHKHRERINPRPRDSKGRFLKLSV